MLGTGGAERPAQPGDSLAWGLVPRLASRTCWHLWQLCQNTGWWGRGTKCARFSASVPPNSLSALNGESNNCERSWEHMAPVPCLSNCSVNSESGIRSPWLQPAVALRNPAMEQSVIRLPVKISRSTLPIFPAASLGRFLLCLLLPPTPFFFFF